MPPVDRHLKKIGGKSARHDESMKDAASNTITPEEFSRERVIKGLQNEEVTQVFRSYDEKGYAVFRDLPEQTKFDYAHKETLKLIEGVKDPDGNIVKVAFNQANQDAINGVVQHFIAGSGKVTLNDRRAFAVGMIKDTISAPDFILEQIDGRKAYVSFWRGKNNMVHKVVVSMDKGEQGKIITSNIAADIPGNRRKAMKKLISDIRNAKRILYTRDELKSGPSGYSRPPSSDRASTPNTRLHPSGNSSIANSNKSGNINRMDTIRSMDNDIDYFSKEKVQPISRREIIKQVKDLFGATVRYARNGKGNRGWFHTITEIIRTKDFADPRVISHELGHYLDHQFKFSEQPKYAEELLYIMHDRFKDAYAKLDLAGQMGEGFAEFFHDYATDRANAQRNAPGFFKYFEERLQELPELKKAIDKYSDNIYRWNHQSPADRIKGHIDFANGSTGFQGLKRSIKEGTFGEAGKKAWNKIYSQVVDDINPIGEAVKDAEKRIGHELPFDENPYLNAWAYRGWIGKAEAMLQFGDPEKGIPSLKSIYKRVGAERQKDFSALLVAFREYDIETFNDKLNFFQQDLKLKPTTNFIDSGLTIQQLTEKHPDFTPIMKDLQIYQRHQLWKMVQEGIIKNTRAAEMVNKYPPRAVLFWDKRKNSMYNIDI